MGPGAYGLLVGGVRGVGEAEIAGKGGSGVSYWEGGDGTEGGGGRWGLWCGEMRATVRSEVWGRGVGEGVGGGGGVAVGEREMVVGCGAWGMERWVGVQEAVVCGGARGVREMGERE